MKYLGIEQQLSLIKFHKSIINAYELLNDTSINSKRPVFKFGTSNIVFQYQLDNIEWQFSNCMHFLTLIKILNTKSIS